MIRKAIAGIDLLIENESELEIREENPAAANFIVDENSQISAQKIRIRTRFGRCPSMGIGNKLFSTEDFWSIFRDEQFYWIVLHPPSFSQPFWVTRVSHQFSSGIVYCSDFLKNSHDDNLSFYNPVTYPLDQILIMHYLAGSNGIIIHSAGWSINKSGWIFAGKSGAGKSTISNLIVAETGTTFLSDDRVAVRKIGKEFLMYGTPWPGDAGYAVNESVPLKGIFFLSKGSRNNIKPLKPSDALAGLMPVVSIPWYDRGKVELMLGFCDNMLGGIPMYELAFMPDKEAVDMLQEFVNEQ